MNHGRSARIAFGIALGLLVLGGWAVVAAGGVGLGTQGEAILIALLVGAAAANLLAFFWAWRGLVRDATGTPWLTFSVAAFGVILTLAALVLLAEVAYMRLFVLS